LGRPGKFNVWCRAIDERKSINEMGSVLTAMVGMRRGTGDDNPLRQVFEQIQLIRGAQFKGENGRPLSVATDKIPAFAYFVCDITPSMQAELKMSHALPTPYGRSCDGYRRAFAIYFEVIDYGRLLSDAKRRNRVFFERLNLMDVQRT
jgi:hypothetical protein